MTSTASSTSSSPTQPTDPTDPTPAPDSTAATTAREHDPGDATVTEQPVTPRFTDRAAARAAQAGQSAPTAAGSAQRAEPAPTPASEPASGATTVATAQARRSPDLRAGARRAATVTRTAFNRLRTLVGEIAWVVCLLAAAALLLGTAMVVLEANTHNALVEGVLKAADWADLGVFSRTAGIKQFTGENALIKNAFVNWGLGAVAWLVVGRIARRILTP